MLILSRNSQRSQRGFTFIEILVAVLIVSFLGGVVFATFSQGAKLWGRAMGMRPQLNAEIFFEKLETELRQIVRYSGAGFKGDTEGFEFHGLASRLIFVNKDEITAPVVVRTRFLWDAQTASIRRRETPYRQMLYAVGLAAPEPRLMLEHVKNCQFEYYLANAKKKSYGWHSRWQEACLPKAIRISLDYDDEKEARFLRRVIRIPAGGCLGEGVTADTDFVETPQ